MSKYLSNTFWLAGLIVAMAALFYLREEYRRDPEQFSTRVTRYPPAMAP
jgi:hypothetical protein